MRKSLLTLVLAVFVLAIVGQDGPRAVTALLLQTQQVVNNSNTATAGFRG